MNTNCYVLLRFGAICYTEVITQKCLGDIFSILKKRGYIKIAVSFFFFFLGLSHRNKIEDIPSHIASFKVHFLMTYCLYLVPLSHCPFM